MSRRSSIVSISSGGGSRPRSAANEPPRRRSSIFGLPATPQPQGVVVISKDRSDVSQLKAGDAFYKTVRRFPSKPDEVTVAAATSISSAFAYVAGGGLARTRRRESRADIFDHRPSIAIGIGAIVEDVSSDSPLTALYR